MFTALGSFFNRISDPEMGKPSQPRGLHDVIRGPFWSLFAISGPTEGSMLVMSDCPYIAVILHFI